MIFISHLIKHLPHRRKQEKSKYLFFKKVQVCIVSFLSSYRIFLINEITSFLENLSQAILCKS